MDSGKRGAAPAPAFRSMQRRAVALEQPVEIHPVSASSFIVSVEAKTEGLSLEEWASANPERISASLMKHGAMLFRGFNVTLEKFQAFVRGAFGEPLDYHERSSPRTAVGAGVYSSTDYPASQRIFFHNENSYQQTWPGKLIFLCQVAAPEGGATPLSNIRAVTRKIEGPIARKFREKGVLYVRNYGPEIGLAWQEVFQTTNPQAVDAYCGNAGIDHEWVDSEHLRTRQTRAAFIHHPKTGEELWFNHAAFFHISTLEASVRQTLLAELEENELPANTYYGDGTQLEEEVVEEIRAAYEDAAAKFEWQPKDVLVVENMLAAHSREPFRGERKIVLSMADLISRSEKEPRH